MDKWEIEQLWGVRLPDNVELLYYNSYSDWSWGAVLIVYQQENKYFVMYNTEVWDSQEVTQEQALTYMLNFEEED